MCLDEHVSELRERVCAARRAVFECSDASHGDGTTTFNEKYNIII